MFFVMKCISLSLSLSFSLSFVSDEKVEVDLMYPNRSKVTNAPKSETVLRTSIERQTIDRRSTINILSFSGLRVRISVIKNCSLALNRGKNRLWGWQRNILILQLFRWFRFERSFRSKRQECHRRKGNKNSSTYEKNENTFFKI